VLAWWRRRSLRARITILATTIFVAAFSGAILLSLAALTHSLTRAVDRSAIRTGQEVASQVDSGDLDKVLLTGVFLTQVVDAQNHVLSASLSTDGFRSMLTKSELVRARAGERITIPGSRGVGTEDPLRVVAVNAGSPAAPRTVLVGADIARLQDSTQSTREIGLYSIPGMAALMAAATYFIVGSSLRGVSALRRGADDITATGRIASRLPVPQSRDETYRLAVTLNAMLDRLEATTSGQRRFVGDAAHELRSPIASLRTQFEVASMLGPENDWSEVIADAMVDLNRLSRLVDDLLALARSDENGSELRRREPVDLAQLAGEVVTGYATAGVNVECRPGDRPPQVTGDADALRRVVVNLVDNAVRHAAGRVEVDVQTDRAEAVLTVADDGPGIPADQREAVFDRFVRLDSARARDTGGTGLGLSIVREIVTAHGGTVQLTDNQPGALVTVRLPLG
jgi:signal transduction histidine kinase